MYYIKCLTPGILIFITVVFLQGTLQARTSGTWKAGIVIVFCPWTAIVFVFCPWTAIVIVFCPWTAILTQKPKNSKYLLVCLRTHSDHLSRSVQQEELSLAHHAIKKP